MYRNNWNMGPRGRNFGHRGFRPVFIPGIIGLFFFGWIFVAALCGAAGGAIMILASVISGLAHIAPRLIRALASSHGFALGVAIGLVWYFRTHRRNGDTAKEEAIRESSGSTVDGAAVETEIIEEPVYRTFNA